MNKNIIRLNFFAEPDATATSNVDKSNAIISNVVAVQVGHARGHDLYCNEKFVSDFVAKANEKGSLHVHLGHISFWDVNDPFDKLMGFAKNFRLKDKKAICDIHFVRNEKDNAMIDKVLAYAEKYPEKFGTSISFTMKDPVGYEEVWEGGWIYEKPIGEYVDNSYVAEVEEVFSVDIVESPAVNNGLFFSQKNEISIIKKREIPKTKTNMKAKTTKAASFCACDSAGKKLGEATAIDGALLVWEGDGNPTVGTTISITDSEGNIVSAPDGIYETDTLLITVANGVVTEVSEKPASEPMSETQPETIHDFEQKLDKIQKSLSEIQKSIETEKENKNAEKFAELLNKYETMKNNFEQTQKSFSNFLQKKSETTKTEPFAKPKSDSLIIDFFKKFKRSGGNINALQKQGYRVEMHNDVKKRSAMMRYYDKLVNFSSSLAPNTTDACIEYYRAIYEQIFYIDPLFRHSTQVLYSDIYGNPEGARRIHLPKMGIQPISPATKILTQNNLQSCDNNTDRVQVTATQRTLSACGSQTMLQICPKQYRYLFNASVYAGAEEIPAEAIIMALFGQIIEQEIVDELVNGTGTGSSWCRGLFGIASDDITATNIPEAQVFAYGTNLSPFTTANVISQLTTFAAAAPSTLRKLANTTGIPAKLFIPYNVFELLVEAVRGLDTAFAHSFLDACCAGWDDTQEAVKFPFAIGYKVDIVPMETFNNGASSNTGGLFLVHPTEFFTAMEAPESIPMPRVCYDCASDTILVRAEYVSGIQYVEPKNVVVALPGA